MLISRKIYITILNPNTKGQAVQDILIFSSSFLLSFWPWVCFPFSYPFPSPPPPTPPWNYAIKAQDKLLTQDGLVPSVAIQVRRVTGMESIPWRKADCWFVWVCGSIAKDFSAVMARLTQGKPRGCKGPGPQGVDWKACRRTGSSDHVLFW